MKNIFCTNSHRAMAKKIAIFCFALVAIIGMNYFGSLSYKSLNPVVMDVLIGAEATQHPDSCTFPDDPTKYHHVFNNPSHDHKWYLVGVNSEDKDDPDVQAAVSELCSIATDDTLTGQVVGDPSQNVWKKLRYWDRGCKGSGTVTCQYKVFCDNTAVVSDGWVN